MQTGLGYENTDEFFAQPRESRSPSLKSRKKVGKSSRLQLLSQARLACYQCLKNRAKIFVLYTVALR
jgi:hypothetical protein